MTTDDDDKPSQTAKTELSVVSDETGETTREAPPPKGEFGANDEALLLRIAALEDDHGDLGKAIDALEAQPGRDRLTVARLKKKKLQLKDEIQKLKDALTPDIIA